MCGGGDAARVVGHWPVFEAGPLGSELGLIKSMFETLGTPDEESWPVGGSFNYSRLAKLTMCSTVCETVPGLGQDALSSVSWQGVE